MSSIEIDIANESTCKTSEKQSGDKGRQDKIKVDEADQEEEKAKHEKKYSELVKQIGFLKKFDWFETNNPLIKAPPIKLLTPIVFWFMYCAEYFPRSLSVGSDPLRTLTEVLQKIDRQPVSQIIRIKDLSIFSAKIESVSEQVQEITKNIKECIRKLIPDKQLGNLRSLAELKDEYTVEDDEFIMSIRSDLLEMYNQYISPQYQGNVIYGGSESTCTEEGGGKQCNQPKQEDDCQLGNEEILAAMKKQDLDSIINLYHHHLEEEEKAQSVRIDNLKGRILDQLQSEKIVYPSSDEIDFSDILVDIHQFNSVELEYLNHLENKQQVSDALITQESGEQPGQQTGKKQTFSKRTENRQVMEDLACQICNDGDYSDDDLIVFCSKCNVSVHQRCYGIPRIPTDDWICELCLSFGPNGKYLQCILCTQRGGAMKPSKININSQVLAQYNLSYTEFSKNCPAAPPNKKQRYQEISETSATRPISIDDDGEKENNLYYDFHTLNKFTQEELKNEPKPYVMWCHVSCALWTPECFFDDKNFYSNVKGIENIDKQRFKLECSVCHQKKAGSCIQCAKTKCMEAFHPECARRANIFMEIRNADKLAYMIYCDKHTPLKLRRTLDQKEKKYKEEIIKFCKSIEKSRENRNKERLTKKEKEKTSQKEINSKESKKKKIFVSAKKIRLQISKNEEDIKKEELQFQQILALKIIEFLDAHPERAGKIKNKELDVQNGNKQHIQENIKHLKEKKDALKSSNLLARWQQGLFMKKDEEELWKEVEFKELSPSQIFKRYKRILRDKDKRKAFKGLYYQMLASIKGIRILSKEERLKEKEKKRLEKINKKQQKLIELQIKAEKAANEASKKTKKQGKIGNDKGHSKKKSGKDNTTEEYDDEYSKLYCVCQKKYKEGDPMMACERCDEWFHFDCTGYIGSIEEAEEMEFVCKFCDNKDKDVEARAMRKKLFGDKFLDYDTPDYKKSKQLWIQRRKEIKLSQKKQNKRKESKQDGNESFVQANVEETPEEQESVDNQKEIGLELITEVEFNKSKEEKNKSNNKRKNSKNGEETLRKQIKISEDQQDNTKDHVKEQLSENGANCNDQSAEDEENKHQESIETFTNLVQITSHFTEEVSRNINQGQQQQLQTENILHNYSPEKLITSKENSNIYTPNKQDNQDKDENNIQHKGIQNLDDSQKNDKQERNSKEINCSMSTNESFSNNNNKDNSCNIPNISASEGTLKQKRIVDFFSKKKMI